MSVKLRTKLANLFRRRKVVEEGEGDFNVLLKDVKKHSQMVGEPIPLYYPKGAFTQAQLKKLRAAGAKPILDKDKPNG